MTAPFSVAELGLLDLLDIPVEVVLSRHEEGIELLFASRAWCIVTGEPDQHSEMKSVDRSKRYDSELVKRVQNEREVVDNVQVTLSSSVDGSPVELVVSVKPCDLRLADGSLVVGMLSRVLQRDMMGPADTGPQVSEEGNADTFTRSLDTVVKTGQLKKLVQQSLDGRPDVAQRAQHQIVRFLRTGSEVLPRTADELEQGCIDSLAATIDLGPSGRSTGSTVSSKGTGSLSAAMGHGSFRSTGTVTGGGGATLNWIQLQRLAAACNGLEVANRWMERLGDLARDISVQDSGGSKLDLSCESAVFLGGSCGKTTWRKDFAEPAFDRAGIKYYNPQRDDWSPELVAIEAKVKEDCAILLFVIDDATRSLVSVLEAVEHICRGRRVFIALIDIVEPTNFDGDGTPASKGELADLNRLRKYLKDVAVRHGVDIYSSVEECVDDICMLHSTTGSPAKLDGNWLFDF